MCRTCWATASLDFDAFAQFAKEWNALTAEAAVALADRIVSVVETAKVEVPDAPVDPFSQGDWLMPPLPMATLTHRLGPGYTDEKTKGLLRQYQLRNFPVDNRQSWTIRLDKMPKSLRQKLETPTDDEKKSQR
jgi:hypothetical protein